MKNAIICLSWTCLIATIVACGGSGSGISGNGVEAANLQYGTPIRYLNHNGVPVYGVDILSSTGHAMAYLDGDHTLFWTSPTVCTKIDTPSQNVLSLNKHDQFVGRIYKNPEGTISAVYHASPTSPVITLKGMPNTLINEALSINDQGEIVGNYYSAGERAIYWATPEADPVELPQAPEHGVCRATHIDNFGAIHGIGGSGYPVVWATIHDKPRRLVSPGNDPYVSVSSYSPNGIAAGTYGEVTQKFTVAAFWARNATTAHPMPPVNGFGFAVMNSCSDTGLATGYFPNSFGTNSAFVFSGNSAIDLKNVTPVQDGWDFVKGIFVDAGGNLTVQGWKDGQYQMLYLPRLK